MVIDAQIHRNKLVTIRKTTRYDYERPSFEQHDGPAGIMHIPAHKDFREKYFQGFKKEGETSDSNTAMKLQTA